AFFVGHWEARWSAGDTPPGGPDDGAQSKAAQVRAVMDRRSDAAGTPPWPMLPNEQAGRPPSLAAKALVSIPLPHACRSNEVRFAPGTRWRDAVGSVHWQDTHQ